ncbi:MAG: hypothetical protein MI806_32315 [Minwuiales bacterium]|nr:hypothetical protein [Minwuiales bacterium]
MFKKDNAFVVFFDPARRTLSSALVNIRGIPGLFSSLVSAERTMLA